MLTNKQIEAIIEQVMEYEAQSVENIGYEANLKELRDNVSGILQALELIHNNTKRSDKKLTEAINIATGVISLINNRLNEVR